VWRGEPLWRHQVMDSPGIDSTRFERQEEAYSVAARHYGDALLAEVPIALLLSYL
jgi:hypothetical protein